MDWFLYDNGLHHERINTVDGSGYLWRNFWLLSTKVKFVKKSHFYQLQAKHDNFPQT